MPETATDHAIAARARATAAARDVQAVARVEWTTLALILGCHAAWLLALFWLPGLSMLLAVPVAVLAVALHSSLTHEAIHGHPFRSRALNEALMFLPLTLFIPYQRFRDQHLAHHRDELLTDPYDDPESNFMDPQVWARLPRWQQRLLRMNNTLLGRVVLGPIIGTLVFLRDEWRLLRAGDRAVRRAWLLHLPGLAAVLWVVWLSPMPVWLYVIVAYAGLAVIKVRTFLEHRAHVEARGRTAIVEDRGLLAFLFLNNNLHVVHHMYPGVPWYRLPALYRARRAEFLGRNDGYVYRSYAEVFRRHFLTAKDPVPHPIWRRR